MSQLVLEKQTQEQTPRAGDSYRFDVDQYHRLAGIVDERVELIGGRIVLMTPIGGDHAHGVTSFNRAFASLWDKAIVWSQNPIRLDNETEPQPDLALIYRHAYQPGKIPEASAVALVIEVADTSLTYDADIKGPLYATAGIAEYWLVDLEGRCLFAYTEPGESGYKNRRAYRPEERIAPRAFPEHSVNIVDLFPRRS